jgi:hypothetical protein
MEFRTAFSLAAGLGRRIEMDFRLWPMVRQAVIGDL